MNITEERMQEILTFDNEEYEDYVGDRILYGVNILCKYTDRVIQGADHDIIYSEDIDNLIEAGITEEDCIKLRTADWFIQDGYLAHFA